MPLAEFSCRSFDVCGVRQPCQQACVDPCAGVAVGVSLSELCRVYINIIYMYIYI